MQIEMRGSLLPGKREEGGEAGWVLGESVWWWCAALGMVGVLGVYMRVPCLLPDFRQASSVPCLSVWRAQ